MESDAPALGILPCACASLRRAARAVSQLYDDQLRGTGLRGTQFTLLWVLGRRRELTQGELGESLAIDSTTLTRTLRPLESAGWIRATPADDDKRVWNWSLTAAGERKLASARASWESAQARLRSRLGSERWQSLLAELASVADAARS